MNVGNVQEYKLEIGKETLTFRLDFKALINFNKKYDNALEVFNNFLQNKNEYDCIVKILSSSCVEKEISEEELLSKLSFDFPTMKTLDLISLNMIRGSLVLDESNNKSGNNNSKN